MRKPGSTLPDVITAVFVLLTVGMIAYVSLLIADPGSPLNPLARPTYIPILVIATDLPTLTPSNTPTPLPPTDTPLASPTPTVTPTRTPTPLPPPSATPVLAVPTQAGSSTALPPTVSAAIHYVAKPTVYQPNRTADGCKWSSIAGTVLDGTGQPVTGIAVRIIGGGAQSMKPITAARNRVSAPADSRRF